MRAVFVVMSFYAAVSFASTAKAEDFTGFYAGVNAGYAFGSDKDSRTPDLSSLSPGAEANERALPPSAVQASETMKGARPRSATPLTAR